MAILAGLMLALALGACNSAAPEQAAESSPRTEPTPSPSSAPSPSPSPSPSPTLQIVDGPITADASTIDWDSVFSGPADSLPGIIETHRGTGDAIVDLDKPMSTAVVTLNHRGSSNFIVDALLDDDTDQNLVNEIGKYVGEVVASTPRGTKVTAVEIRADGPWAMGVKNVLLAADADQLARRYQGTGDSVLGFPIDIQDPQPFTVFDRATISHDGDSNFIVDTLLGPNLINDIGPYSGTVRLPRDGLFGLEIIADGHWVVAFF